LVEGTEFHHFYFRLTETKTRRNTTMTAPRVRLLGDDAAVVTYVRLTQYLDAGGTPQTSRFEETRIWQRQDGIWRHVHFHRSANS
jgi:calcium/calmodulin-dependent protein kinase (CaM kinase) II